MYDVRDPAASQLQTEYMKWRRRSAVTTLARVFTACSPTAFTSIPTHSASSHMHTDKQKMLVGTVTSL